MEKVGSHTSFWTLHIFLSYFLTCKMWKTNSHAYGVLRCAELPSSYWPHSFPLSILTWSRRSVFMVSTPRVLDWSGRRGSWTMIFPNLPKLQTYISICQVPPPDDVILCIYEIAQEKILTIQTQWGEERNSCEEVPGYEHCFYPNDNQGKLREMAEAVLMPSLVPHWLQ